MYQDFGKLLILAGVFLLVLGLLFLFWEKIPFVGKLPGDIAVQRKQFGIFFPIITCIVISLVLTILVNVILWLLKK